MTSEASSAENRSTSTRWPSPLCSRSRERGEDAGRREQPGEHVDERRRRPSADRPSGVPVMLISPPIAWIRRSYPGSGAPAPDAEPGDRAVHEAAVALRGMPRNRARAGRARRAGSSRSARRPPRRDAWRAADLPSVPRSSAMLRLLRLTASKYVASPSASNGGPHARVSSPTPGRSTLSDAGAEVAEHHRRERPRQHAGEVEDAEIAQSATPSASSHLARPGTSTWSGRRSWPAPADGRHAGSCPHAPGPGRTGRCGRRPRGSPSARRGAARGAVGRDPRCSAPRSSAGARSAPATAPRRPAGSRRRRSRSG